MASTTLPCPAPTAEAPPATLGFQHLSPGCYHCHSPSALLTVLLHSIPNYHHCPWKHFAYSTRLPHPLPGCAKAFRTLFGLWQQMPDCHNYLLLYFVPCLGSDTPHELPLPLFTQLRYPLYSPRLWLWAVSPSIPHYSPLGQYLLSPLASTISLSDHSPSP